jgi:hypothetical protein
MANNTSTSLNSRVVAYRMTLAEFLARVEYLAQAIDAVDAAARNDYQLASFS